MNKKIILWYIGYSLLFVSALMAVSGIIACFTPGDESRTQLLLSAFLTGIVGIFPLIFVRKHQHRLNFAESNCVVVCSWSAACIFGMLPFFFYGGEFTFINALFESVSGFTTTGASILNDIEALPRGLQFWRISTAWVGGLGIVTLFSMLMRGPNERSRLSGAEMSSYAMDSFKGERIERFANRMFLTYIILTSVTAIALKISGLGWFDSVATAMSACSTCGFCTKNSSIAFFSNPAAEVILTFAMIASGINFGILFMSMIKDGRKPVWKSETSRVFLFLVLVVTIMVSIDLYFDNSSQGYGVSLRHAAFQVASISTTTGFATQDTTLWPPLSMALLLLCSLVCGCSGSTSGGIKMDRALLAVKGIWRKVSGFVSPSSVKIVKMDGHTHTDGQVSDAFAYIFCYLLLLVLFAGINLAAGLDFTTGLTASIACIGNVGPGFGDVGSMGNYAAMPTLLKGTCILEMLTGRLEIFPVLYLIRSMGRKS